MHEPILAGLESYLSGQLTSEAQERFAAHLAECAECRGAVEAFGEHAGMMRQLRSPVPMDPAPGFYARVMERIESQAVPSLWSIFLEPVFGGRLMAASLALSLLILAAVWTTPHTVVLEEGNPMSVLASSEFAPASGQDMERDREVVFVNLATYGSGSNPASLLPVSSD
jgi:anti-sigma factor RsiW